MYFFPSRSFYYPNIYFNKMFIYGGKKEIHCQVKQH